MVAGNTYKNLPSGAYGFGVIVLLGSPSAYNHITQFYIPDNNSGFYFRSAYSGVNGATNITSGWQKISFSVI